MKAGSQVRGCPKHTKLKSILDGANDWVLIIDLDDCFVWPIPEHPILSRPDVVIVSMSTHTIIWGEFTSPLERRILISAQIKTARYSALKTNLRLKGWIVHDYTFEVGAIGAISLSTRHFLKNLGFPTDQVNFMYRRMSEAARRSSFYIWNARHTFAWHPFALYKAVASKPSFVNSKSKTTVVNSPSPRRSNEAFPHSKSPVSQQRCLDILLSHGIKHFYHFTESSNLPLIREYGLFSWKELDTRGFTAVKGSDELSRRLDKKKNLEDFVRLSFTASHPMMWVCKRQGRLKNPVVLKIDISACLLPGTLFSDRNATATDVHVNSSPCIVHFDTVKATNHFEVEGKEKPFFQAEILIKNRLPARYISFPESNVPEPKFCRSSSSSQLNSSGIDSPCSSKSLSASSSKLVALPVETKAVVVDPMDRNLCARTSALNLLDEIKAAVIDWSSPSTIVPRKQFSQQLACIPEHATTIRGINPKEHTMYNPDYLDVNRSLEQKAEAEDAHQDLESILYRSPRKFF